MPTTEIVIIYKTKNVSKLLGKKGPLLGTYLVETVSCPLEAPLPHPKKKKLYMVASESPSQESSDQLSPPKAEESVS